MPSTDNLHASCVAYRGKGALIIGASGSGKSSLALQMIALGADLVADDRTDIFLRDDMLFAKSPPQIFGLIEARNIGILRLSACAQTVISVIVDLDRLETDRLPPQRQQQILGKSLDLIYKSNYLHFPAALMCYLAGMRAQ